MDIKKLIVLPLFLCLFYSKLGAQEITIFPSFWGYQYYQDDNRITKQDLISLLEKKEESYSYWKKSKTTSTLAYISGAAELGFFAWQMNNYSNDKNTTGPFLGVLGSFGSFLTFALISNSQKKKAILKYNEGLSKKSVFRLAPSKQGFGLALQF
ncbi:hypothetical protein [Flagellimonas pacifica]|uniref:DUF5683 domain-containing protein n=1 Tax=Flagellimonas pacifica TaxID=1247520 RepID=A0A285ME27_9FLAO|nr:hypothetical protein [Allomuricauda parva]SNY94717.1 hypothetical protein SAMN06265377_0377 [Allomuricauda parva]